MSINQKKADECVDRAASILNGKTFDDNASYLGALKRALRAVYSSAWIDCELENNINQKL